MRGARGRARGCWQLCATPRSTSSIAGKVALETEWSESAAGKQPDSAPDPERSLIDQSRRDRVRSAIAHLQPEFREALVLREIAALAYKEIGFVLKIPIGTVMSRLSRARDLLARELLTEGVENMSCVEARPLLHAYLDGELDLSASSLSIEQHPGIMPAVLRRVPEAGIAPRGNCGRQFGFRFRCRARTHSRFDQAARRL